MHMRHEDWCDRDKVMAYAKTLGTGLTVFRNRERPNYNIAHTENTSHYKDYEVVGHT